jgi:putative copper resistance protein D
MSLTLVALYAVVRGLIYLGLLLLIGSQTARSLIARALADDVDVAAPIRDRVERLAPRLMLPLLALFVARGALQVLSFLDPGEPVTVDIVRIVLGSGPWGQAWLVQLAAALVLVGVLRFRRVSIATSGIAAAIVVAVVVWAQTGMGHAATNRWPGPLGRILDGAHLLGGGLWLGTLGVLAIVALPLLCGEERLPALARVVRAFSRYARAGVLLMVVSGAVAALVYAGSIDALLGATWGRLLLLKLTGMIGVLALGWYNWRVVTPAIEATHPNCRARLRVAVRLELLLALAMLAITTMLVVSPLPGEG